MRLKVKFAETYRQKVLAEEGRELPDSMIIEVNPAELPEPIRAELATVWPADEPIYLYTESRYAAETEDPLAILTDWQPKHAAQRIKMDAYTLEHATEEVRRAIVRAKQIIEGAGDFRSYHSFPLSAFERPPHCDVPEHAEYKTLYPEAKRIWNEVLMPKLQAEEAAQRKLREDREAARCAKESADREKAEHEKASWIKEHGSPFLRKATGADYNCQRKYVCERRDLEHPGYVVDFDNTANWEDRCCPSEAALEEALAVKGTVVWLIHEAGECIVPDDQAERWDEGVDQFRPCEAVVIRGYLGKYDLVREV